MKSDSHTSGVLSNQGMQDAPGTGSPSQPAARLEAASPDSQPRPKFWLKLWPKKALGLLAFVALAWTVQALFLFNWAQAATTAAQGTQSPVPNMASAASTPLPAPEGVQAYQLANGMTLIVKPDRRAPSVTHMLWVRVGSMDETDGTSGVAHVLEHMMFKGTATLKPGEFSKRVAALGGQENAFTSTDYTAYFQSIPAARLSEVMALEADRFANNRYSDEEFKKELEVVKEERRLRTDDQPRSALYERLRATAFMASPYRRPIIGWMSDLDALQADDARAFYKRWYTPRNAAVVVVGDVEPQAVRQLAERWYGGLRGPAVPERKPQVEPVQRGVQRLDFKAPAEQTYLLMGYKVPQYQALSNQAAAPTASDAARAEANREALALTVLSAVLDGYSGARLDRALTQSQNGQAPFADSTGADYSPVGRGPQLFHLEAVVAAGRTALEVQTALQGQIERIAREGVSPQELERVKNQWVASEVYKRDSLMVQARELGSAWALGQPLDLSSRLIRELRGVTTQEVQAVAKKYFTSDALTVAVLVPQPKDKNAPARKASPDLRH